MARLDTGDVAGYQREMGQRRRRGRLVRRLRGAAEPLPTTNVGHRPNFRLFKVGEGQRKTGEVVCEFAPRTQFMGGSLAEWLACWTQAQKGVSSNRGRDAVG